MIVLCYLLMLLNFRADENAITTTSVQTKTAISGKAINQFKKKNSDKHGGRGHCAVYYTSP